MEPFIKLESHKYKNVPTQSETQKFESYMRGNEIISKYSTGHFRSGIDYFSEEDKDDLAYAFEMALDNWYKKQNGVIYTSATKECVYDAEGNVTDSYYTEVETIRGVCKKKEDELKSFMEDAIKDHMKRTGGNIGHFPYSGERVLMSFKDDVFVGKIIQIKLDPFDLYWPDANKYNIEQLARYNKTLFNQKPPKTQADRIRKHAITFMISLVFFLIACFVLNTFHKITFSDLFIHIRTVSAIVAIVCFYKFAKEFIEKNFFHYDSQPNFYYEDGFYTSVVKTYDKARFAREIKELHNYYQIQQIWSDFTGRPIDVFKQDKRNDFYKEIEPFVINGKDYIQS